jgi:hypothetical protein
MKMWNKYLKLLTNVHPNWTNRLKSLTNKYYYLQIIDVSERTEEFSSYSQVYLITDKQNTDNNYTSNCYDYE